MSKATCERKIRYLSEKTATNTLNRFKVQKYYCKPLHVYHCEYCNGWHLGSVREKLPWGKLKEMRR